MAQMTQDELRALTDSEMRQAVGYWSGKLAMQRQRAMYFYHGEAKNELAPPEVEGRSAVVAPVVRNTIESMLPQLMVKFAGSDQPVEFQPIKPGDEKKAEQATDYISLIYNFRNNGERVTYTALKDALLSKVGIVKVWWDERFEEKREEYKALSDVELAQVLDDDELTVIEQQSYPDEEDAELRQDAIKQLTAQMQQNPQAAPQIQQQIAAIQAKPPVMLYDISCKRVPKEGRVRVENVPPEEFLISRKAKDIQTAPFVGHRKAMTIGELESLGYKNIETTNGDDAAAAMNLERIERLSIDDELAYLNVDQVQTADPSQRVVWVTECFMRIDFDGDGIPELRRVLRVGTQILENEVVDCAPFVAFTPIPMPHKFFGLSVADLAIESQKIETALLRGVLDNTYLQINGRYFAVDGQVNLDDLLTSRPGGVVRIKAPGMAGRLDQGAGDSQLGMGMLEYMKGFNEDSTGWTRYNQGADGDSLNQTATGVTQITSRADMRLDLIARNLAEGFRELFRLMLKLVSQHQTKEDVVNIRGEWVAINPTDWRNGFEICINVGLGTGNKDQQVAHLMALLAQQQFGLQVGTTMPQNVYEAQKQLAVSMGFKSGDKFFTDPSKAPPRPPQPTPEQIKAQTTLQVTQMQIEADRQKTMLQMQADAQKFQAEMQARMAEIQQQHQAKMADAQASLEVQASNDARDSQREEQRALIDAQMKQEDRQHQAALEELRLQLEKYRADLDAQVKLAIAEKTAAPQVDAAPGGDSISKLMEVMAAPSEIVRDPQSGRAVGIRKVTNSRLHAN